MEVEKARPAAVDAIGAPARGSSLHSTSAPAVWRPRGLHTFLKLFVNETQRTHAACEMQEQCYIMRLNIPSRKKKKLLKSHF